MAVISQSQLERASVQTAMAIDSNLVFPDQSLTDYLSALGARIVAHSAEPDRAFSFKVLRTSEPTGFTLPGGQVYLSRGLLALATSEDEVACAGDGELQSYQSLLC